MSTRKQLTRSKDRYVSQQESYRNLPTMPAAASPVDGGIMGPQVSEEALRLKSIAESLASGSKALQDFLSMEKSFEATNIAANKARALMGLPPVSGQGHLDYGVDEGYRRGLGLARSKTLAVELEEQLRDNNYFVDPQRPSITQAQKQIHQFTDTFLRSRLGEFYNDEAFMMGAAETLAAMKVESFVTAGIKAEGARRLLEAETFKEQLMSSYARLSTEEQKDPQRLRELLTEVTKDSQLFRFNRDALMSFGVQSLADEFRGQFADAQGDTTGQGLATMVNSMDKLRVLTQAMGLKDSAGVLPGGIVVDQKTGKMSSPLKKERKELQILWKQMYNAKESLVKHLSEELKEKELVDLELGLQSGELTYDKALDTVRSYQQTNPKIARTLLDRIDLLRKSDRHIVEDPDFVNGLLERIEKGGVTQEDLIGYRRVNLIRNDTLQKCATYLRSIQNERYSNMRQANLYMQNLRSQSREEDRQTKASNKGLLSKYLADNPKLPSTAVTRMSSYVNNANFPVSIEVLANIASVRSQISLDKDKLREDKAAQAKVDKADKLSIGMILSPTSDANLKEWAVSLPPELTSQAGIAVAEYQRELNKFQQSEVDMKDPDKVEMRAVKYGILFRNSMKKHGIDPKYYKTVMDNLLQIRKDIMNRGLDTK